MRAWYNLREKESRRHCKRALVRKTYGAALAAKRRGE